MTGSYDLVVHGGDVVEPSRGRRWRADVAFAGGRVAAVEPGIAPAAGDHAIDASGLLVAPGFIDLHGHYFLHAFPSCVDADAVCPSAGVTTAVDAGSGGCVNFAGFVEHVAAQTQTRLFGFVNLSALGLAPVTLGVPELRGMEFARLDETIAAIADAPGVAVGVKVRADVKAVEPEHLEAALRMARTVADASSSRIMVHVAGSPVPLGRILNYLRGGDIVTHIYHGDGNGLLDRRGHVEAAVVDARAEGVHFDVGHAGTHLCHAAVQGALADGFVADTISTDIHRPPPGSVTYDLPSIMSVFLSFGLTVEEVVSAVTLRASRALGLDGEIGALRPGAAGDAAIFELEPGTHRFADARGEQITSDHRIRVVHTIVAGRPVYGPATRERDPR